MIIYEFKKYHLNFNDIILLLSSTITHLKVYHGLFILEDDSISPYFIVQEFERLIKVPFSAKRVNLENLPPPDNVIEFLFVTRLIHRYT